MSDIKIGAKNITVNEGEVFITDGESINIPIHSVKTMLGLYKFKEIKDKEVRTFEKGELGWIEFAQEISGIYIERYGNKTTLPNVKELATELGIKQVDIKRGLSIAKGEDFSGEKWVEKQPPMLVFEKTVQVPILKVFKNTKLEDNPKVKEFFKENPIVKQSLSGKKLVFKDKVSENPIYNNMYGKYDSLKDLFKTNDLKTLLKKAKSKALNSDEIESIYNNVKYNDDTIFKTLIEDVGIPSDAENINSNALEGVIEYTAGSSAINGFLQGFDKNPSDMTIDFCKSIDEAFKLWGFHMDKDSILYRGQRLSGTEYNSLLAGYVLPFESYVSFSLNLNKAAGFCNFDIKTAFDETYSGYDIYEYDVIFIVKGFDKILCLLPGMYSKYDTEEEIIANRGFGLKLLRKLSSTDKSSAMLECEVVTTDILGLNEERKRNNSAITQDMTDLFELLRVLNKTPEGKKQLKKLQNNSNVKKWQNFVDFELFN